METIGSIGFVRNLLGISDVWFIVYKIQFRAYIGQVRVQGYLRCRV